MTPQTDAFPPVIHSDEWEKPVPLEGPINTAGAEDSPFVTPDGKNLYFFFTPDVNVPPQKQLVDGVTGVWWSRKVNGKWTEPVRVVLGSTESLDGAVFILNDTMWFASVRRGNYGEVDIYTARFKDGRWTDVKNAGELLNKIYDVGELCISPDGRTMYYGCGGDICMMDYVNGSWVNPRKVPNVNSELNEDQPFITPDGRELWFTGQSRLGYPGPAIFRSVWNGSGWGKPEEIISNFAGEPALDAEGNVYFVHHFFTKDMKMIEADIYVAYRKKS
ncbi:PD40 domain-containing protein [Thermococcus sp. 5-4]|uniref:TolB family protein n=1 Tax=Thermococcus sp. 5-4 TaxID=2008440 RepID=UPI00143C3B7A|nr:PD40 domain-containing protein [Thermococcus sp. 5-4]